MAKETYLTENANGEPAISIDSDVIGCQNENLYVQADNNHYNEFEPVVYVGVTNTLNWDDCQIWLSREQVRVLAADLLKFLDATEPRP